MDALQEAIKQMAHAEQMDSAYAGPALQWVQAYAAIAQAQELKSIAWTLECIAKEYMDQQHNRLHDPATWRSERNAMAPDAQDFDSESGYFAAREAWRNR